MRIVHFPAGDGATPEQSSVLELEAALSGEAQGALADAWRELRVDVRSLAPPMAPGFEQRLREELDRGSAQPRRRLAFGALRRRGRPRAIAAVASAVLAGLLVVALVASGTHRQGAESATSAGVSNGATMSARHKSSAKADELGPAPVESAASQSSASAGAAPEREQQLAASVTLSASPADVQAVSDGVARLAVSDEGFVQSSHVQVQQHGSSEASLTLSLPSARLSAALSAIGGLAPVSAESQSLQDITDTYDAARQRLADANAERQALLKALAGATTEGQIDSLRERLSQARSAIAQAQSAFQALSRRASTAEVEVTVRGDARSASEGLTLHRGLHDAGRVLTVALIALLIAAAVLVPLTLLIAVLAGAHRVWRRYRRERALSSP
jgi:uncharacterized protein YhaN